MCSTVSLSALRRLPMIRFALWSICYIWIYIYAWIHVVYIYKRDGCIYVRTFVCVIPVICLRLFYFATLCLVFLPLHCFAPLHFAWLMSEQNRKRGTWFCYGADMVLTMTLVWPALRITCVVPDKGLQSGRRLFGQNMDAARIQKALDDIGWTR